MTTIINNLKDPSWWFSAFFVAIIAGVIAALVKARIEKLLSNVFTGLKSWQAKREEARNSAIEALLADHFYFQLTLFRAVLVQMAVMVLSIICLITPIYLSSVPEPQQFILGLERKYAIWFVLVPVVGLVNMIGYYKSTSLLALAMRAAREYRKRNNLPKLP